MKVIKYHNLTKSYGEKILFQSLDLTITENAKIGLIGINGTGKSNLLAVLADVNQADSGELSAPQNYTIGYLSQETRFPENKTILDIVFSGKKEELIAISKYEKALEKLTTDTSAQATQEFQEAELLMDRYQAWNLEVEAKVILQRLGLNEINKQFKELSGGEQKRVGLAQVLISAPDLLLLDEPTNHLDYQTITWLETYLKAYKGSVVVITHDRYFLDNVTNQIWELDKGKLFTYTGNYEAYLEQKQEYLKQIENKQYKQKQLYKQELAWMRAGVKARGTKQEARKNRFKELEQEVKQQNNNTDDLEFAFNTERLGKKVIELKAAKYEQYGKTILHNFNLLVQKQERLGIIGKNGSGKTTFLNILAGLTPLEAGELIVGPTVKIGYYKQKNEDLDPDKRIINYLQEIANTVTYNNQQISVTELLERFLFPRHMHGTLIGKLSGGERRRLYLLSILIKGPNVLLLDEPTNDLDITTLTILEDYLQQFQGAVITVSHDRYFLDKIAKKLLIFAGNGKIDSFYGNATEYFLANEEKAEITKAPVPKKVEKEKTKPTKKKLNYQEQREWEVIEEEIDTLEQKIQTLQNQMLEHAEDYVQLAEEQKELEQLEENLEAKWQRYEYLAQYA